MGANAQTSVPLYVAAEVLTAANMNISAGTGVPVFATTVTRDAAFGGAGEKVLAEGQLAYIEASDVVQYYTGSAWATVGPATAGSFTFITKATFSAVASVSMAAGTFTSTYKNYKVLLSVTSTSASQILSVRANTGGTPDTSSTYLGGFTIINTGGTVTGLGSNTTSGRAIYTHSTVGAQLDLTVYDPITAGTGTSWSGTTRGADSGDSIAGGAGGIYLNAAASNDGLTFVVAGTITGYYSVYGIKDS